MYVNKFEAAWDVFPFFGKAKLKSFISVTFSEVLLTMEGDRDLLIQSIESANLYLSYPNPINSSQNHDYIHSFALEHMFLGKDNNLFHYLDMCLFKLAISPISLHLINILL